MTEPNTSSMSCRVRVAATFTAEPLADMLAFWAAELGMDLRLEFAPYGQVFQDLLRTGDDPGDGRSDWQVVLVRFADWSEASAAYDQAAGSRVSGAGSHVSAASHDRLSAATVDLAEAVRAAATRYHRQLLVMICPSPGDDPAVVAAQQQLAELLRDVSGVQVVSPYTMLSWFPQVDWHRSYVLELGAVPYSEEGFAALATAIARGIHAVATPRPKVIAVDCDNTIWDGEVAEAGITVPPARRELQRALLAQVRAGRLLCLCSRNSERDVVEVIENHPDMLLRPEHVTGIRANWQPKSDNLRSLAEELNLGLDTFVFLDDDPLQVAEVRARAPEVLALQLPADATAAAAYVRHCWPLDAPYVTAEDAVRTRSYQDNQRREEVRRASVTLADFLARLELEVTVRAPESGEWERVAQLTQRTNQFNLTGARRSPAEVSRLAEDGRECLVVDVRDRFGSYGLVGLLVFSSVGTSLAVDTFLLSCRALGRGVEHRMLAHLGGLAEQRGLDEVRLPFRATDRNVPAADFLNGLGGRWDGGELVLTTAQAVAARYVPQRVPAPRAAPRQGEGPPEAVRQPNAPARYDLVHRIASEFADPAQVLAAARARRRTGQPTSTTADEAVPPRTPVEAEVMRLWSDLVSPPCSVHDDFFELGGDSLELVLFLGRVVEEFGVTLPPTTISESSVTVAAVAAAIDAELQSEGDAR